MCRAQAGVVRQPVADEAGFSQGGQRTPLNTPGRKLSYVRDISAAARVGRVASKLAPT
jgi:hypothetical protein